MGLTSRQCGAAASHLDSTPFATERTDPRAGTPPDGTSTSDDDADRPCADRPVHGTAPPSACV